VKVPTSAGSTGMIRPSETMSISTVSIMKRIAAGRSRRWGGVLGAVKADTGVLLQKKTDISRCPLPFDRAPIVATRRKTGAKRGTGPIGSCPLAKL
jgi:hypothetical protein